MLHFESNIVFNGCILFYLNFYLINILCNLVTQLSIIFPLASFMIQNWYYYSKTESELQALDFARNTGLSVVTVCPTLIWGPILQASTINSSSLILLKLFQGVS